ncbi:MAG: hypothetical protein LBQ15_05470 [Clostridium sp.]|nr:hypothetical protein [Clostridium sp.]
MQNEQERTLTVSLRYKDAAAPVSEDGKREYTVTTADELGKAFLAELKRTEPGEKFTTADASSGGTFPFPAKDAGTDTYKVTDLSKGNVKDGEVSSAAVARTVTTTTAADACQSIQEDVGSYTGAADTKLEDHAFTVIPDAVRKPKNFAQRIKILEESGGMPLPNQEVQKSAINYCIHSRACLGNFFISHSKTFNWSAPVARRT